MSGRLSSVTLREFPMPPYVAADRLASGEKVSNKLAARFARKDITVTWSRKVVAYALVEVTFYAEDGTVLWSRRLNSLDYLGA